MCANQFAMNNFKFDDITTDTKNNTCKFKVACDQLIIDGDTRSTGSSYEEIYNWTDPINLNWAESHPNFFTYNKIADMPITSDNGLAPYYIPSNGACKGINKFSDVQGASVTPFTFSSETNKCYYNGWPPKGAQLRDDGTFCKYGASTITSDCKQNEIENSSENNIKENFQDYEKIEQQPEPTHFKAIQNKDMNTANIIGSDSNRYPCASLGMNTHLSNPKEAVDFNRNPFKILCSDNEYGQGTIICKDNNGIINTICCDPSATASHNNIIRYYNDGSYICDGQSELKKCYFRNSDYSFSCEERYISRDQLCDYPTNSACEESYDCTNHVDAAIKFPDPTVHPEFYTDLLHTLTIGLLVIGGPEINDFNIPGQYDEVFGGKVRNGAWSCGFNNLQNSHTGCPMSSMFPEIYNLDGNQPRKFKNIIMITPQNKYLFNDGYNFDSLAGINYMVYKLPQQTSEINYEPVPITEQISQGFTVISKQFTCNGQTLRYFQFKDANGTNDYISNRNRDIIHRNGEHNAMGICFNYDKNTKLVVLCSIMTSACSQILPQKNDVTGDIIPYFYNLADDAVNMIAYREYGTNPSGGNILSGLQRIPGLTQFKDSFNSATLCPTSSPCEDSDDTNSQEYRGKYSATINSFCIRGKNHGIN